MVSSLLNVGIITASCGRKSSDNAKEEGELVGGCTLFLEFERGLLTGIDCGLVRLSAEPVAVILYWFDVPISDNVVSAVLSCDGVERIFVGKSMNIGSVTLADDRINNYFFHNINYRAMQLRKAYLSFWVVKTVFLRLIFEILMEKKGEREEYFTVMAMIGKICRTGIA